MSLPWSLCLVVVLAATALIGFIPQAVLPGSHVTESATALRVSPSSTPASPRRRHRHLPAIGHLGRHRSSNFSRRAVGRRDLHIGETSWRKPPPDRGATSVLSVPLNPARPRPRTSPTNPASPISPANPASPVLRRPGEPRHLRPP